MNSCYFVVLIILSIFLLQFIYSVFSSGVSDSDSYITPGEFPRLLTQKPITQTPTIDLSYKELVQLPNLVKTTITSTPTLEKVDVIKINEKDSSSTIQIEKPSTTIPTPQILENEAIIGNDSVSILRFPDKFYFYVKNTETDQIIWKMHQSIEAENFGGWEPQTFRVFAAFVPNSTYIGFGAWVGPMALFAAKYAKMVYCLEPDPQAFERLQFNVKLNPKLSTSIKTFNQCIGPTVGQVVMSHAVGDSRGHVCDTNCRGGHQIRVNCTTLPLFVDLNKIDGPMFIKVDTEGHEKKLVPTWIEFASKRQPRPKFFISMHQHLTDSMLTPEETKLFITLFELYKYVLEVPKPHGSVVVRVSKPKTVLCEQCDYLLTDELPPGFEIPSFELTTPSKPVIPITIFDGTVLWTLNQPRRAHLYFQNAYYPTVFNIIKKIVDPTREYLSLGVFEPLVMYAATLTHCICHPPHTEYSELDLTKTLNPKMSLEFQPMRRLYIFLRTHKLGVIHMSMSAMNKFLVEDIISNPLAVPYILLHSGVAAPSNSLLATLASYYGSITYYDINKDIEHKADTSRPLAHLVPYSIYLFQYPKRRQ